MQHIKLVIDKIVEVGLKLKLAKCKFVQRELGHVVSHDGLRLNSRLVEAVQEFPSPRNIQKTRRFLGLASRFIPHFAKVAHPLHYLTWKDIQFFWSPECERAFEELKRLLITAPVLTYPNFETEFILVECYCLYRPYSSEGSAGGRQPHWKACSLVNPSVWERCQCHNSLLCWQEE